jgi:ribose transport system ATP-binding protein
VNYRLELENVTKTYGNTHALRGVSLAIPAGKIRGLVGENGAGKSTLSKIVAGDIKPTSGTMKLNSVEVPYLTPVSAGQAGIAIVHQWGDLVPAMTVEENIFLGNEIRGAFYTLNKAAMRRKAGEILRQLGVDIDTRLPVSELSPAHKQIVAISKALMKQCDLLIVDEGGVSLDKKETTLLHSVLRQLRDQKVTIIYISHLLDDVVALSDEISVMRNGTLVETLNARETTADQLAVAVVGHEIRGTSRHVATEMKSRKVLLDVQGLSWAHDGSAFSLALHEGEILGITGPEGAGKSELLRTIFGLMPQAKGTVTFDGQILGRRSPREMLRRGAAFVPEDRFTEGLLLNRSIEENVSLPHVALQGGIFAEGKRLRSEASRKTTQIRTKMASIESAVKDLSGGNQQKVVISRWLEDRYRLLLLDEPYKGIDIGAKDDINQEIRTMAAGGRGIVVISTEFAELVGLVTTLLVVVNRKIVATLTGEAIIPHEIVRYYQYEADVPNPSAGHLNQQGTAQSTPTAH